MTSEFGVKRRVGKTISSTFGYAMFILSLPQPGEGFEKKKPVSKANATRSYQQYFKLKYCVKPV